MLTEAEKTYQSGIVSRMRQLKEFLGINELSESSTPVDCFKYLSAVRSIQGNLNNDVSFAASLLAKEYLTTRFGVELDAAEKPQGAPGLDIDEHSHDAGRVVGEIKTTVPYQMNDFGAQQAASFKKDFAKLSAADAEHKFLFVTDERAFAALQKDKYTALMPGIRIVNLISGEEYAV
ncbi:hypothetical protein [Desulfovermiculus halophilus]|uniref:hypothetical protein n=1 Tax=Desulfovermiculus halophilus TaxID=339722 RepID=UPI0004893650|nr:hypothetical protein [Desulfovermiculus halophilus]